MLLDLVQCEKLAQTMNPETSNQPASSLQAMVYLFSICGVDYFGPFQVKDFLKTVKKWFSLHRLQNQSNPPQNCAVTGHAKSINSFVARRGCPKTIRRDNGTSFVGAAREFRELFSALNGTERCCQIEY